MGEAVPKSRQEVLKYILSEINLLRWPFFALTKRHLRGRVETEYRGTIERDGSIQDVYWNVTSNAKYGYPGAFDKRVKVAIDQIISELGFPVQNPIPFTLRDICRRIGVADSGKTKHDVREAVRRIKFCGITARGSFYDRGQERWVDINFNLYDMVVFTGETMPDGTCADRNYVFLGSVYLRSLNSFYVKPFDYSYFIQLNSPVAARLYEYLGVRFFGLFQHDGKYVSEDYHELCRLLPLTPQIYLSSAKQKLEPAHRELMERGFLSQIEWYQVGLGWQIKYYPGPKASQDYRIRVRDLTNQLELPLKVDEFAIFQVGRAKPIAKEPVTQGIKSTLTDEQAKLATALSSRGVTPAIADDLVGRFTADQIRFQIEHHDWLMTQEKHPRPRSGRWFVEALEGDYRPPKGFKRPEQVEEARQKRDAQTTQQKEVERTRKEADDKRHYLSWLKKTPEERWNDFEFIIRFRRENGRSPSPEEARQAREDYLANPESPEEYQIRIWEKVRWKET